MIRTTTTDTDVRTVSAVRIIILFSAKSSRHFESRSSLHVSDLAALTIAAMVGSIQAGHAKCLEWS